MTSFIRSAGAAALACAALFAGGCIGGHTDAGAGDAGVDAG